LETGVGFHNRDAILREPTLSGCEAGKFFKSFGGGGFCAAKTSGVELLALRGVAPRAAAQRFEGRGQDAPFTN
jgi:hypothetical protein